MMTLDFVARMLLLEAWMKENRLTNEVYWSYLSWILQFFGLPSE